MISELEPKHVFSYFDAICGIPHGSGNTQKISDFCVAFAKEHGLAYRQEPCGNVIIWKDATPGYEHAPTVMLQGHMDMVAVKTEDCPLDLETDGLLPAITEDGEWVYAKGTSLGGDDGIALAYAMAILADDTLIHPPLEAVFTVDEEIGLLGAAALDASDLKSKVLLNMDSEDDGIFLTSCAGGATMECRMPVSYEEKDGVAFEWVLSGLQGGHSGVEASLGRANANVLFGRFLLQVGEKVPFSVGDFCGGEKDNAIANKCKALLVVDPADVDAFCEATRAFEAEIQAEYALVEPGLQIQLTSAAPQKVFTQKSKQTLCALLVHMPAGVIRMMPGMEDMVQTSLNLGVLSMKDGEISMVYSVRSASRSEKSWLLKRMDDLTTLLGGYCLLSGDYPAWEYVPNAKIQRQIAEAYTEVTGKEATFVGIHAGVECGLISEKLPGIECISFGPQMCDIHTTREKLHIASVKNTYDLTVCLLEKLAHC